MPEIIKVKSLHFYPIKSCRGIELRQMQIGPMGPEHDRRYMVVNGKDVFVAQRGDNTQGTIGVRSMCMIVPRFGVSGFVLSAPGMPDLPLPFSGLPGPERQVQIWRQIVPAVDQGNEAAEWFTEYLSRTVPGTYRLVHMPDPGTRRTEIDDVGVAFADGFPLLITSQASLDALNETRDPGTAPIPMDRFRTNIVIEGCDPFFEDELLRRRFTIGDVTFTGVKPCVRCPITTINQVTGECGKFPLNMLAKHHEKFHGPLLKELDPDAPKGAIFGMNVNHDGTGTISRGDTLIVQ